MVQGQVRQAQAQQAQQAEDAARAVAALARRAVPTWLQAGAEAGSFASH